MPSTEHEKIKNLAVRYGITAEMLNEWSVRKFMDHRQGISDALYEEMGMKKPEPTEVQPSEEDLPSTK